MSTLTNRVQAVKPTTSELVDIATINGNMDKLDNNFIPSAKLRLSVDRALPANSVNTQINFDVIDYDSYALRSEGAMASIVTDQIVCRKSGLYLLSAIAQTNYNASFPGGYRALTIFENAALLARDARDGNTGSGVYTILSVNDVVDAIAGDVWYTAITNTSGGTFSVEQGWVDSVVFSATWLGSKS
jgi:hypothetical protein